MQLSTLLLFQEQQLSTLACADVLHVIAPGFAGLKLGCPVHVRHGTYLIHMRKSQPHRLSANRTTTTPNLNNLINLYTSEAWHGVTTPHLEGSLKFGFKLHVMGASSEGSSDHVLKLTATIPSSGRLIKLCIQVACDGCFILKTHQTMCSSLMGQFPHVVGSSNGAVKFDVIGPSLIWKAQQTMCPNGM